MKESLQNFATTLLVSATLTTSGTSFSVTAGTGVNFPSTNFVVTIDSEILFISSRLTDTFTIGIRAFDGSILASHAVGATVQLTVVAYTLNHLWSNMSDTYYPDVPRSQGSLLTNGTINDYSSTMDTNFDGLGAWTLYPSASGGTIFNINSQMESHLVFQRAVSDNTLYTAYGPYTGPSGNTATFETKLCEGIDIAQVNTQNVQTHFFISDQATPTASADSGNRFRVDVITTAGITNNLIAGNRTVRAYVDVTGIGSQVGPTLQVSMATPLYLRISYDGSGTWKAYIGDGYCYTLLTTYTSFTFTVQSMGYQFVSGNTVGNSTSHWAVSDFMRVSGLLLRPLGF